MASVTWGQNGTDRPQVGYNLDKLGQFWSQELPAIHEPSFRSSFTSDNRRLVLKLIYVCSSNSFGFSIMCASNLRIKHRIWVRVLAVDWILLNAGWPQQWTKCFSEGCVDGVFFGAGCNLKKGPPFLLSFETSFGTRWKMFDLWRVCVMLTTNGPKWPNRTMKATEYKSVKLNVEILLLTLEYQSIPIIKR